MGQKLYCGTGKENITPERELLVRLPGLMGGHFSGIVHDEIFVRALLFQSGEQAALLVEFDLDKAPDPVENLAAIEAEFGLTQDQVLFFAVHAHTAPISSVRPFEAMNSTESKTPVEQAAMREYAPFIRERMLKAVREAFASLQPVRIGWETGKSYINVNRCQRFEVEDADGTLHECCALGADPEGPVDHTLFVLKAENESGETVATFVNYAVHCVAAISNDSDGNGGVAVSGDIAGVTAQMVEAKYGGVCVWSSGAAGDVNPIFMNQYYYPNPENGAFCEHRIRGAEAAFAELAVLSGRHFDDIKRVLRRIECTCGEADIRTAGAWSKTPGRRVVKKGKGPDAPADIFVGEGVEPYPVRLHTVQIGDLALCGISGELYTTLGWAVQEASPAAHTCIINHDACLLTNSGYILDDATIARCEGNLPGHFIPGAGESAILPGYVKDSLVRLTKELLGGGAQAGL